MDTVGHSGSAVFLSASLRSAEGRSGGLPNAGVSAATFREWAALFRLGRACCIQCCFGETIETALDDLDKRPRRR